MRRLFRQLLAFLGRFRKQEEPQLYLTLGIAFGTRASQSKSELGKTLMPGIVIKKPRIPISFENPTRAWSGLVWHHSASPDGITRDWEAIRRYHTSYRVDSRVVTQAEFYRMKEENPGRHFEPPWQDIGYHAGSEKVDGKMAFHFGRGINITGAHAGVAGVSTFFNEDYLGLCSVGCFDLVAPDQERWDYNLAVTRTFMDRFFFMANKVIGHREVYTILGVEVQKSCPGKLWDVERFRREL